MVQNGVIVGFCPICWSPVYRKVVDGKTVFYCPKCKLPINFVYDEHPLAKHNEFVKHCDSLGITDLEACC